MKKIISLAVACILAAVMLTGCSGTDDTASSNNTSANITAVTGSGDTQTVSAGGYDKTFDGFVQYMTDGGYIKGDGTDLTASAIGAAQGKRFTMSSGTSKYSVELYEYEDQTSELAQRTIANARADHSFHLYESTESAVQSTYAVVTEDGRFLMLYTDTSASDASAAKKEEAGNAVAAFK